MSILSTKTNAFVEIFLYEISFIRTIDFIVNEKLGNIIDNFILVYRDKLYNNINLIQKVFAETQFHYFYLIKLCVGA